MLFKIIAIAALAVVFLFKLAVSLLEKKSEKNPVPENVSDVYDAETYAKWRSYHSEKVRTEMITSALSFVISLVLIATDAFSAFASLFPDTYFLRMLAVFILSAASDLLLIPVRWYDTMVTEEKYGFNRTSAKTFWADEIKGLVISLVISLAVGLLLMWVHLSLGDWMIVVFAAVMTLFILFISFIYPILSKIFNKFTPLEDGELKDRLTSLLEKHGYRVRAIQVMDGSKRSTKSNAYFTGFGKMKTIVLFDTLVKSMTPDEICAVFAHEMGHGLHRDTLKNQILTALQMAVIAVLAWLTLRTPGVFESFGFEKVNYGFAVILIMTVEMALLSPLFALIAGYFSRKAEFRADRQAAEEGYGEELITALKKLARENFSDLSPDPLLVRLTYTHPPVSRRIEEIERHIPEKTD